jgi:hypothetical protein
MNNDTFASMLRTLNAMACTEDLEDLFVKQYIILLDAIRKEPEPRRQIMARQLADRLSAQVVWLTRRWVTEAGHRFIRPSERLQ